MLFGVEKSQNVAASADGLPDFSYAELTEQLRKIDRRASALRLAGRIICLVTNRSPQCSVALLALMENSVVLPASDENKISFFQRVAQDFPGIVFLVSEKNRTLIRQLSELQSPVVPFFQESWNLGLQDYAEAGPSQGTLLPPQTRLVLMTSGSTGGSKYVPLTIRNLLSSTQRIAASLQLGNTDACISMMPNYHIGGIVDTLLVPLSTQGQVMFCPPFDLVRTLQILQSERASWLQSVPRFLAETARRLERNISQAPIRPLRFIRAVSAPLTKQTQALVEQAFKAPVLTMYGMTETAGQISSNTLIERREGSVGRATNDSVKISDEGEILVRGDGLTPGYLFTPSATSLQNGWFNTGDCGYLDKDGFLFLTGRKKEIINRGGEKISPLEIDEIVLRNHQVADAACFGVPDESKDEKLIVAVVPINADMFSSRELKSYLAKEIPFFKMPDDFFIVQELARKNGKLIRGELAEAYKKERGL